MAQAIPFVLAASAGAGAAALTSGGSKGGGSAAPAALPKPPDPEKARDAGAEQARRRKAQGTKTIFTSPLGLNTSTQAAAVSGALKTKLGQ